MFAVRASWPDGTVLYQEVDGDATVGHPDPARATRLARADAETAADRLRGGSRRLDHVAIDVVPVAWLPGGRVVEVP